MSEQDLFETTLPVAPLKIAALAGSTELAEKINTHLVNSRHARSTDGSLPFHFQGYLTNTYLLETACPRFGTGEAKGIIKESVRGRSEEHTSELQSQR